MLRSVSTKRCNVSSDASIIGVCEVPAPNTIFAIVIASAFVLRNVSTRRTLLYPLPLRERVASSEAASRVRGRSLSIARDPSPALARLHLRSGTLSRKGRGNRVCRPRADIPLLPIFFERALGAPAFQHPSPQKGRAGHRGLAAVQLAQTAQGKTARPTDLGTSRRDRKSTRLNSSHANISYAVFCLKKKKKKHSIQFKKKKKKKKKKQKKQEKLK